MPFESACIKKTSKTTERKKMDREKKKGWGRQ